MKVMTETHTSAYITSELKNTLYDFSIRLENVFAVTTDNAANMLKCVKIIEEEINDDIDDDELHFDNSVDDDFNEYEVRLNSSILRNVRCASHTLQLCLKDFFKNSEVSNLLEKARLIVRTLKSHNIMILLRKLKHNNPILGN